MREPAELERFERLAIPHLGAGYNLARWLTHSAHDADDVVQEAYLRGLRSFDRYRRGDPRAWLLTIVRNTCYTWPRQNRAPEAAGTARDVGDGVAGIPADPSAEPEVRYVRNADRRLLHEAVELLPADFREVLVRRELEGFSYKEIADIVDVPVGTVMSRLARARQQLLQSVRRRTQEGA